jgi:hypothetical protein
MYIAIDLAGNKSPIYTQKYTIDKIPPKIFSIIPINNKIDYSRTASIYLKFNEKIFTSTKWNYIKIKNLTTGKYLTLAKSLSNNVLLIKTSTRTAHIWYQIIIPIAAVRDTAGNKLAATYTFKFKTGA